MWSLFILGDFRAMRLSVVFVCSWLLTRATFADSPTSMAPVDFVRDIRPIFEHHCYACHGEKKQKSGLRLDRKLSAMKGGDLCGACIIPGNAEQSPLIQFVANAQAELRMPPEGAGLGATEIDTLTRWVNEGGEWPEDLESVSQNDLRKHWSFQPIRRPLPPQVNSPWPRNGIDRFVLSRLLQAGLAPSPEADRVTWLRRVTLDLTGLPPTPEQVESFVQDVSLTAYERVVDSLLNSPSYGERWAQHWLDVVRYADTHGFEVNTERPNAWPYRDYVIQSFNRDTPYDQFIKEQIVGDVLEQDAATGFLVTASVLLPGQIGADEPSKRLARQDSLDEIVVNVGQSFLALSIACARCHDHKFDPISQRDYYALQAMVAGVEYGERDLRTPEAQAEQYEILRDRRAALGDKTHEAGRVFRVFAGTFRAPDDIHLLARGNPEQPKESVAPAVLPLFDALPDEMNLPDLSIGSSLVGATFVEPVQHAERPDLKLCTEQLTIEQHRRWELADWIASRQNPLTARVMANRIWQYHFGIGLVETSNDFGHSGQRPSHPELLDWLASELSYGGWSVKRLHRLIVLSAAYRQVNEPIDPSARAAGKSVDADGRLLWRSPSRRLDAEIIRDTMLVVSGQLNLQMYGRGFDLFDQRGGLVGFKPIERLSGEGLRRMIYAHKVRRERDAVFGAFDCPDGGQSTARRKESTTPIQSLNLFNSDITLELSAAFAARVQREVGKEPLRQTQQAYRLALAREPDADELSDAQGVVVDHGLSVLCRAIFNSNEFLFVP